MIGKNLENPMITISVKVYQALLIAYPRQFQLEYGSHMLQVFRDCCLRTFHQSSFFGMLRLWAITLIDLVQSVVSEHTQKETFMTRSNMIRVGGWSLMLGGVTFLLFFLGVYLNDYASSGIFIYLTPFLLLVGILGLRTRYGDEVGSFGKTILLLGAIAAPVANLIGYAIVETVDWGWILLFTGPAISLVCIGLFGLAVLRSKPLPRWNALPLLTGIWYPIPFFLFLITQSEGTFSNTVQLLIMLLQSATLFLLGYVLQGDAVDEASITT